MPKKLDLLRAGAAVSLPLALLVVGALLDPGVVSSLFITAGVIFFTVMLFEAALERGRVKPRRGPVAPAAGPVRVEVAGDDVRVGPKPSDPPAAIGGVAGSEVAAAIDPHTLMTARLIEVFAFVGTSTPTLVGVARVDGLTVLKGWLDLLSARLSRAVDSGAGAMVVRESLVLGDGDFIPVCAVGASGGSRRCTLPAGSSIELLTGDLPVDVAQAAGARKIYMASFDTSEERCWVCITFTTTVSHELLRPLCDLIVAPIAQTLSEVERKKQNLVVDVTDAAAEAEASASALLDEHGASDQ